jgi:hypothetical protein
MGRTLPHDGLVCGQTRLEACTLLGQREIPAIVIVAAEAECLVMSLAETCPRHQHRAIDLPQGIQSLGVMGRNRGSPRRLTARAILAALSLRRRASSRPLARQGVFGRPTSSGNAALIANCPRDRTSALNSAPGLVGGVHRQAVVPDLLGQPSLAASWMA